METAIVIILKDPQKVKLIAPDAVLKLEERVVVYDSRKTNSTETPTSQQHQAA